MLTKKELKELKLKSNSVRINIIKMISESKSGHPAGSLGIVDILITLYSKLIKHNPKKPNWNKRDRFILSPGHVCPALYATLAEEGYFKKEELITLRKLGSKLQGHPHKEDLQGIELSTASLGQGLGAAVGIALGLKLNKSKNYVYCISSDGEHDEGSVWEAVNAANKYKLNNLINIIDVNNIQICGYTKDVWPLESFKAKYESFNWKVIEINGNNHCQIVSAIEKAKKLNYPVCIVAYTVPGKGVSFMEHKYQWHGKAPNQEEKESALQELEKERELIIK
ncbi:transketolase [archaeon]|jgi:transketolase|nr:transketolase [archaeon]MBT3450866.1 transketolase [archaeon]MBT6869048.1 transketolase [archaeon]MBT7193291.1 transketolase [archaeon]MBT7380299.1 transketolase [archaeon]